MDESTKVEVEALNQISEHQNVINMKEHGKGEYIKMNGKPSREVTYIVLDHAGGGELFDIISMTGKFNDKVARHYFKQLASGVSHCHDFGIAHRDLKPENVFMTNNYELKVADFGLSTMLEGKDGKGLLNTYVGTEAYMAPEILEGKSYDGRQVDVFACGIILFIMIAQVPPFFQANKDDPFFKYVIVSQ